MSVVRQIEASRLAVEFDDAEGDGQHNQGSGRVGSPHTQKSGDAHESGNQKSGTIPELVPLDRIFDDVTAKLQTGVASQLPPPPSAISLLTVTWVACLF